MENDNLVDGQQTEVLDEVEIEQFAKRGQEVPRAKRYVIRIDKDRRVVDTPTITGRQILALVGKTPEMYKLYEHRRGHQPMLIGPDEVVHLHAHGIERFTTMPRDTTEGRDAATLSREFRLPEADEDYLDGRDLPWETARDTNGQWLIIHAWRLPSGYKQYEASVALLIPPGYSDSQIDMAYFCPPLSRRDNKTIGALSTQKICGQGWQRWSRHRTTANPWRVGVDDVASHLALVDEWLRREFEGGR
ncbi:MAG: multiubiquitin domain-containing protein [Terriglobia bacterium]